MGRQEIKIVSLFSQQLETKIKPLTASNPLTWKIDEKFLKPILTDLGVNFRYYFSDIDDKFANIGAKEWKEANSSKTSMQEFATKLNLVDETINCQYWTPVVEAWNKVKPPSSIDADNISAIMISKTTSMKCFTALAAAVALLKETTID